MSKRLCIIAFLSLEMLQAQIDTRMYDIVNTISAERIKNDITILANFGTRHTMSDTISQTRGIGAARRWIKSEFDNISSDCNHCLDVFYQKDLVKANKRRIIKDVMVVNVVAIQRGTKYPDRYIIMSGDIDSRVSDPNNSHQMLPGQMTTLREWPELLKQPEFYLNIHSKIALCMSVYQEKNKGCLVVAD